MTNETTLKKDILIVELHGKTNIYVAHTEG